MSTVKNAAIHGEGPRRALTSAGAHSATNAIKFSAARAFGLYQGRATRIASSHYRLTLSRMSAVKVRAVNDDGKAIEFQAVARIDTPEELVAFRHGGILPYVLRQLVAKQ